MAVNHYLRYVKLFEFGKRVQKGYLKLNPRNFYRISKYEYADGDVKSMTGNNSSLIFVLGVHDEKVNCIKLNEVDLEVFMRWFPTMIKPTIKAEDVDAMEMISDLIIDGDRSGKTLFESKVKGKTIYNKNPRPYRTYNLDGLQYIQEIKLKAETIKDML